MVHVCLAVQMSVIQSANVAIRIQWFNQAPRWPQMNHGTDACDLICIRWINGRISIRYVSKLDFLKKMNMMIINFYFVTTNCSCATPEMKRLQSLKNSLRYSHVRRYLFVICILKMGWIFLQTTRPTNLYHFKMYRRSRM